MGVLEGDERGRGEPLSAKQMYMFVVLALVYACHLVDRTIILVLLEPIKHEFQLNDSELGLLSGTVFALGTVVAALPLGTMADRRSRKRLLAVCIAAWSAMTLLGGLATSFVSLLALRFGVGATEAGLQPTALSMVADETTSKQRARAVAIVHVGIPVGTLVGFIAGGWIATHFGWRHALVLVGIPGLLLAAIVWLTLREPERQVEVAPTAVATLTLKEFFAELWQSRPLFHVVLGLIFLWLCTSSVSAFLGPFFIRMHHLPIATAALVMAGTAGVGGLIGNLLSGVVAQKFAQGRRDRLALIAALAGVAYFPLGVATFLVPNLYISVATLFTSTCVYFMVFTPGYSLAMDLADARIRARTAAVISMGATAIGYGLGPQIVGILSDLMAPALGAQSLRYALLVIIFVVLWSAGHFFAAYRRLRVPSGTPATGLAA